MSTDCTLILVFGFLNLLVVIAICVSGSSIPAYPACAATWNEIKRRITVYKKDADGKPEAKDELVPIDPDEIMEFVAKTRRDWLVAATITASVAMICVTVLIGIALNSHRAAATPGAPRSGDVAPAPAAEAQPNSMQALKNAAKDVGSP